MQSMLLAQCNTPTELVTYGLPCPVLSITFKEEQLQLEHSRDIKETAKNPEDAHLRGDLKEVYKP